MRFIGFLKHNINLSVIAKSQLKKNIGVVFIPYEDKLFEPVFNLEARITYRLKYGKVTNINFNDTYGTETYETL